MAIGTSLPELLSGLVGVFVPGAGDTGLGTVLGSLVFNLLVITGLCIIVVPGAAISLNRVATIRDVTCQVVVIGVLCWAFSDHQVDVNNVIVFLCLYVLYILVCWKSKDVARILGYSDESDESDGTDGTDVSDTSKDIDSDSEDTCDARARDCDDESDYDSMEEGRSTLLGIDHKPGHDLHDAKTLLALPEANAQSMFFFILSIPLVILEASCHMTIPDCHSRFWKRHCDKAGLLFCTTMCIVWITILVFFMIEWAVKAGELLGIEASIMGLTFCAAGTSAPDCICSVIVAKQGRGNMAISNVFGSNVFDILIAMAIPWALRYQIMGTQSLIKMEADGFATAVFILALVMIFYVACVAIGKFTLPRKVGYLHVGLYGVFLVYVFVSNLAVFKA
jgi:sodium/potassium/calcium exchanger 5